MTNMSYCRFHNTLIDLRDCYEEWEEPCSAEEAKNRAALLRVCQDIVADFGDDGE